jgi:acetylornithine deacetylase
MAFDLFSFTRRLIDVESTSFHEAVCGELLLRELSALGFKSVKVPVEGERFNVWATWPETPHPAVVFSTHFDCVPPFFPSREDDANIFGRGACDAKGIIASQVAAALKLREQKKDVGLLFVVGEERDSLGAKVANKLAQELHGGKCKLLINGEPTENKVALASKGTLRAEVTAKGKMAHSAYPHLGESAIEKLIEALHRLKQMPLPVNDDPQIGACTLNFGLIEGGRAPNVIPDHAKAHLLYRLVGPSEGLRKAIVETVGDLAQVEFPLELAYMRFQVPDGMPTMVAAFTTDIPKLTDWGRPILFGPGSIHVAHTEGEFVSKSDLRQANDIYSSLASSAL